MFALKFVISKPSPLTDQLLRNSMSTFASITNTQERFILCVFTLFHNEAEAICVYESMLVTFLWSLVCFPPTILPLLMYFVLLPYKFEKKQSCHPNGITMQLYGSFCLW